MLKNIAPLALTLFLLQQCPKPTRVQKSNLQEQAYELKIQGKFCSVIVFSPRFGCMYGYRLLWKLKCIKVTVPARAQHQNVLRSTLWHTLLAPIEVHNSRRSRDRLTLILTFDLIFIGGQGNGTVMDYPCAKFGDFSFSRFGFILQLDRIIGGSTLYSRDYRWRENKKDGYR